MTFSPASSRVGSLLPKVALLTGFSVCAGAHLRSVGQELVVRRIACWWGLKPQGIGLTPGLSPAAKWLIIKGHNQWPKKAKLFD